jgi:glycosyltransferase involved in cell wall biosynthesis
MRVVLADPPAYTPPYDHALAAALVRCGVDVQLLTSPFRYGAVPVADGYTVDDSLYRLSARIRHPRTRVIAKAIEHPLVLARLAVATCDVVHLQWVAAPEVDAWLMRARVSLVFTAHDLLPRRTAAKTRTWKQLFGRFDRIITHSERGSRALETFGVPAAKLRVVHHPVFRSDPVRADDGHTVLALGVIRPYKGLPDAVAATLAVPGARLLVAGDPRFPLDALRAQAGARVEWRLGFLGEAEIGRALGSATVAVFPYRPELDQSGALLQAIGAGVPAVVYDVGGLGEVVRAFGAGRVVPAGDVSALTGALGELLGSPDAMAEARAGAERARAELTWDAAARAHRSIYEELE